MSVPDQVGFELYVLRNSRCGSGIPALCAQGIMVEGPEVTVPREEVALFVRRDARFGAFMSEGIGEVEGKGAYDGMNPSEIMRFPEQAQTLPNVPMRL